MNVPSFVSSPSRFACASLSTRAGDGIAADVVRPPRAREGVLGGDASGVRGAAAAAAAAAAPATAAEAATAALAGEANLDDWRAGDGAGDGAGERSDPVAVRVACWREAMVRYGSCYTKQPQHQQQQHKHKQ